MTTLLLIRHGRSTANVSGVLAGRTAGVSLDDRGREQAADLARRLSSVPLSALVSSPLERCRQTAAAIAAGRDGVKVVRDRRLAEVDYGAWTNRPLRELSKESLWSVVQSHPSAAVFPDGEGLAAVQTRAVSAVRAWNTKVGPDAAYAMVSHGDVIKAVLADALGMHLDMFQRIIVDPCSVSVVSYTHTRPFVARVNDVGGDVSALTPPPPKRRRRSARSSDAVPGGSTGAAG